MKPEVKQFSTTVGSQTYTFETGKLAGQAGGAVTFGSGDNIVFSTATMGGVREGIDYFPLSVDYEERMYAGGKIPGSFFRREGRAHTEAILTARLLFQYSFANGRSVPPFCVTSYCRCDNLLRSSASGGLVKVFMINLLYLK